MLLTASPAAYGRWMENTKSGSFSAQTNDMYDIQMARAKVNERHFFSLSRFIFGNFVMQKFRPLLMLKYAT